MINLREILMGETNTPKKEIKGIKIHTSRNQNKGLRATKKINTKRETSTKRRNMRARIITSKSKEEEDNNMPPNTLQKRNLTNNLKPSQLHPHLSKYCQQDLKYQHEKGILY